MSTPLPQGWQQPLDGETNQPYFTQLQEFVEAERNSATIYPPESEVFTALALTPYADVRVLVLGQDPYHGPGQAHGLSFSVKPGVPLPPSLVNIFKELRDDLDFPMPNNGYLVPWAEQGVLMLNTVLTVRAGEANSHKGKGWERFTDAAIQAVSAKNDPVVFVLWGKPAQKKLALIDADRHVVIQSAHPSPLSARNGFFGSKPFSKINAALEANGSAPINWRIPNL